MAALESTVTSKLRSIAVHRPVVNVTPPTPFEGINPRPKIATAAREGTGQKTS
jgi:hypothetical protein